MPRIIVVENIEIVNINPHEVCTNRYLNHPACVIKNVTCMKNKAVTIIAGPCSINEDNQGQLFDIARIAAPSKGGEKRPAIWGLRVVGLKSRTSMEASGVGMGMDFPAYQRNLNRYINGEGPGQFEIPPSVHIANRLIRETGLIAATEVVDPTIQLPPYERILPKNKFFVWNPAVNQLGYQAAVMGKFALRNGWGVGIKNGKWLGAVPESGMSTMEKTWVGLAHYAAGGDIKTLENKLVMIQRGVDVAEKGEHRNLPVHDAAKRVKDDIGVRVFFDPSHTFGTIMRDHIVDKTIDALRIKTSADEYLYDGLLIEVGDSLTDTGQHITILELQTLAERIAEFRDLESPTPP